jgi:hypothetical protein
MLSPSGDTPIQLADARQVIGELVELLRPACERIEIAGSVRRGKPEVHDAEVVIIPTPDLIPLTDTLIEYGTAQYALYGEKRLKRWGNNYRGLLFKGIKCELFMTNPESWGYQYWLRTGPGDANTFIMKWLNMPHLRAPVRFRDGYGWYSRNWRHDGKGWVADDKQRLRIASEEDLFAVLGMPFLPPSERTEMMYKKLTNKRAYVWPEYAPYFAQEAQQGELIPSGRVNHFFDGDDVDEKAADNEARWAAEREYNERLKTNPRTDFRDFAHYNMWSGDITREGQ